MILKKAMTDPKHVIAEQRFSHFRESSDLLKTICEQDPDLRILVGPDPTSTKSKSFCRNLQVGDGANVLAILILMDEADIGRTFTAIWDYLRDHSLPFRSDDRPTAIDDSIWQSFCEEQWLVLPMDLTPLGVGHEPVHYDVGQIKSYNVITDPLGEGSNASVTEIVLHDYQLPLYRVTNTRVSSAFLRINIPYLVASQLHLFLCPPGLQEPREQLSIRILLNKDRYR